MKKFFCTFIVCSIFITSKVYAENNILKIEAPNALLYDLSYEKILYEKNINEKISNASTTKILTAIVAYENSNMEDMVEISARAASIGGSKINLRKGSRVKMDTLMKGLLISSGNDAAIAIAEHVGGSVDDFCEMMNQKAKELGAKNTNFVTPHGLDNDDHYTTLNDLLIFSKYFIEIPYLKNITNTEEINVKLENYSKNLHSTNEMLFLYDSVNGIKTGYTSKAGRCLITSIESGDRVLIAMVMGCNTKTQRTSETIKLINFGYNNFEVIDLCKNMKKNFEIRIRKANREKYELKIKGKKFFLLSNDAKERIRYEYEMSEILTAPVEKGKVVGKIKILLDDQILSEIELKMPYQVVKKDIFTYFSEILKKQNYYLEIKT